jgi:hypothetical protein
MSTDCLVAALGREHRRLWDIDTYGVPLREEMRVTGAMIAGWEKVSYTVPTSEEGWAFLGFILSRFDDDNDPDSVQMQKRILDMFERRFDEWPAAA